MLPTIEATGNLVADPELRFTKSGKAVASFRLACNSRRKNASGQWEDGDTTYLTVSVWEGQAEAVTERLAKGSRVVVIGSLTQREYESNGERRTVYEVKALTVADVIRPSATAPVAVPF